MRKTESGIEKRGEKRLREKEPEKEKSYFHKTANVEKYMS